MNNTEPAFPVENAKGQIYPGLTKREWFAGMALPKLIELFTKRDLQLKSGKRATEKDIAQQAYYFADAMLTQSGEGK